jgi:hypothetical protein
MSYLVLLAEADARGLLDKILDPQVLPLFIPIVAILGGIGAAITGAIICHRERMARIERGPAPDGKDDPGSRLPCPSDLPDTAHFESAASR